MPKMKGGREELDKLYVRRFKLWRELVNIEDFARGTVVILRRPCTYKNCRLCKQGKKHPATYLSISKEGKTKLMYLPRPAQEKARQWTQNYRKLRGILEEVSDTNHQILRLLARRLARKKKEGKNAR